MNFNCKMFIMINESVEKAFEIVILNGVKNPGFIKLLINNRFYTQEDIPKNIIVCQNCESGIIIN